MRAYVVTASLSILALGCANASDATGSSSGSAESCASATPGSKGPGAFDPDYKSSTAFFTQMSGLNHDGTSVHGATQIWYSCNLHGILDEAPLQVPEGTVAIKVQDRNKDGVVESMRVMVKHAKGYAPMYGDFSFEARDPDGSNPKAQSGNFCFGCHQGYPETGYLAGTHIVTN